MCNGACIEFGLRVLAPEDVAGKSVIEVGALDVNGSLRSNVEALGPSSYVGVDLEMGTGVDRVCDATELISQFGGASVDLVLSTEMLEHVREWRAVISNMKNLLKPGGVLLITTRSKGYGYHGAPFDIWRYELPDMRAMFSDVDIEVLEDDPMHAGVFIKVRKPTEFSELDLTDYSLYSIFKSRRILTITETDFKLVKARLFAQSSLVKLLPQPIKRIAKKLMIIKGKRFWLTTHY